jgi:hypothetical protein
MYLTSKKTFKKKGIKEANSPFIPVFYKPNLLTALVIAAQGVALFVKRIENGE